MATIREREQNSIRSVTDLEKLAEYLKDSFSFSYKTIQEARKTIGTDSYTYSFDATSLYLYQTNLNLAEYRKLRELMYPFYEKLYKENREAYKELCERRTLLPFLSCSSEVYQNSSIEKQTRPDFILTGSKRIGIELTELTTPDDKNLFSLTNEIQQNSLKEPEEIEKHIKHYHSSIENKAEILDIAGIHTVGYMGIPIRSNRMHFAEQIKRKYGKYSNDIGNYDEFIILADAASGACLEITEKEESDEVFNHLLTICPEVKDTTVVIAWRKPKQPEQILYSWYQKE